MASKKKVVVQKNAKSMCGNLLADCYSSLVKGTYDPKDVSLKLNLTGKLQKERVLNFLAQKYIGQGKSSGSFIDLG